MALSSAVDWSSLLPELLNRIAECFLVTSDLDYYIDFRAVCRSWRSATKDPKSSPDPRFRPRHWVIIDRHLGLGSHKTYLWVNTATGRFVPKELPLLGRYGALCTTPDGLLILNDSSKSSPCTVSLLNAFTGYWVHFAVPLPGQIMESAALISGSPPTLVLLCKDVYIDDNFMFRQSERKVYMAYPDSESYTTYEERYACPLIRLALRGIYTDDGELGSVAPFPVDVADKIFDLMSGFYNAEPDESYDSHDGDTLMSYQRAALKFRYGNCCYLVRSDGEILIIFKLKNGGMEVYRMDTHSYALKRVKDIGNRTIFLGSSFNCISVNPDKFPSLDANCIYYIKILDYSGGYICMYNPRSQGVERISRVMGHCSRPCTIIQHLSNYGLLQ